MTRRARQAARVLSLAAIAAVSAIAPACARDADPAPEPALTTETTLGPVRLHVSADQDEIRAADRLRVTVELDWAPAARVEPVELPAEDAGWTIVSREDIPPHVMPSGRLTRATRLVLEPDLPGEYDIPPARAHWTDSDQSTGVAQTEPLRITVAPMLDDAADLLALAPQREPPPHPPARRLSNNTIALAAIGFIVPALCAILVAAWLIRRAVRATPTALHQRLDRLQQTLGTPEPDPLLLCNAAADTIHAAPPTTRAHTAIQDLARRLDLARFSPAPPPPETARELAARTLDLFRPPQGQGGGA